MASDKLPPGWRRVTTGLYQHDDPFALVRQDNLGRWKVSINLLAPDGSLRSWHSHGYAAARDAMAAGHGLLAATPLKLLTEARAVMRACGWHLAPAADSSDDPTLALAAAEIEAAIGAILDAAQGEMG